MARQAPNHTTPANLDAERWIIGAALKEPDMAHEFELPPGDFILEPHRHVWAAVQAVMAKGERPDVVLVGQQLREAKLLEAIGGPVFLGDLMSEVGTLVGLEHHVRVVREDAARRRLIEAGTAIATRGYDPGVSVESLHEFAEGAVFGAVKDMTGQQWAHSADALAERVMQAIGAAQRGEREIGTPTGLDAYDRITGGLQDTDLIVLGGRPGMGKTAYALTAATNVASGTGKHVAIFSLEMGAEQLAQRVICSRAGVDLKRVRTEPRKLTPDDNAAISRAAAWYASLPLTVIDRPGITPAQVRTECRRLGMRTALDMVVVDYIQLMEAPGESREQQVSKCGRSLKGLAKEFKIPVLALSQLNRKCEDRQDKRPLLSDLRESGAIEQDADLVVFTYRDEYYDPDTDDTGIAEIIVAKQRNGPTGTARVAFDAKTASFRNLSHRQEL